MGWNSKEFLKRVNLTADSHRRKRKEAPVLLTAGSIDPQTNLIVSLASVTEFDEEGRPRDLKIKYWRHLPYGESKSQNLLRVRLVPGDKKKDVEIDQLWVQSRCVFDRSKNMNPDQKNTNRILEAINRINTHLREGGAVEDTAKLLSECYLDQVIGEDIIVRGLKKEGGFEFSLSPVFMKVASSKNKEGLDIKGLDPNILKSVLGFRINTLEPDKNFSGNRTIYSTDPQSGVMYESGVILDEQENGDLSLHMFVTPQDVPEGIDAQAIPKLLDIHLKKQAEGAYTLTNAAFLGQKIAVEDTQSFLKLLGIANTANKDFANWKYPAFMDSTASFDFLDLVNPLKPPPSLEKEGGEFLYVSLHGTGFEQKISDIGDQIGTAALFLHRGLDEDNNISTVGLAVDFPFAMGGDDLGFEGVTPDYMPFWKDLQAFALTHDHFDHADGLPYYAAKGLMREKTVYCTPKVKAILKKRMTEMSVPKDLRPKIKTFEEEGSICLYDEKGNRRIWKSRSPEATNHSSPGTPYIITGCYNDQHYNGSALIYGDSNGLSEKGEAFAKQGPRILAEEEGVTPQKVDYDISIVLHDVTAVRYEGHAPTTKEVEETLYEVSNWFPDKGILFTPFSTNSAEYRIGLRVANRTGRNITGVGANAEKRLSILNLHGIAEDYRPAELEDNIRTYLKDHAEDLNLNDPVQYATRSSETGKGFRTEPGKQFIFTTGPQNEKFSTMEKFGRHCSLLDVDEIVRPTGYKINGQDFVSIIPQANTPGKELDQEALISNLIRNRGVPVVLAFVNGFKLYNLEEHRQKSILSRLNQLGWKYHIDPDNNIRIYNKPLHVHGHGFKEDLRCTAQKIPARIHEAHHIPDYDSYITFTDLMNESQLSHSGIKPDDFQVFRINGHAKKENDILKTVAWLNPSYMFVRMVREYGKFYGGFLEMVRTTMFRRDGNKQADGLHVRTSEDGIYQQKTARIDWELANNDQKRPYIFGLASGPSAIRQRQERTPRSRMAYNTNISAPYLEAV